MKRLFFIIAILLVTVTAGAQDVLPPTLRSTPRSEETQSDVSINDSIMAPIRKISGTKSNSAVKAWTDTLSCHLDTMMTELSKKVIIGCAVYDLTDDSLIYNHNGKEMMIPASTQKLFTAVTALDKIGYNYDYGTYAYRNGDIKKDSLGNRYLEGDILITGSYDPTLTREHIQDIAHNIYGMGIDSISGHIIAVGFNFTHDDALMPIYNTLKDDNVRFPSKDPTEVSRSFLCKTLNARLISCIRTPLKAILERMMKRSNNDYAESMLHNVYNVHDCTWTYENCKEEVRKMVDRTQGDRKDFIIDDGSGLSRSNRCTPELQTDILRYAYHKKEIFPYLYRSLPIAGVDGTLSKRMKSGRAYNNVRAKTGTIYGVSTLTGYVEASNGHRLAFSIMMNNILSSEGSRDFQDRICQELAR